jgi:hypothetical protein
MKPSKADKEADEHLLDLEQEDAERREADHILQIYAGEERNYDNEQANN